MNHNSGSGHAAAILTILIWGTTFLSTKVLLRSFQPIEILVLRFLLGFLALLLSVPKPLRGTTRRLFAYGLLFMLPALGLFPLQWDIHRLTVPGNLGNLLFLGLGASALCFVTWNFAVKRLGAVKTSVYIYLVPVITVTASALLLGERLTVPGLVGTALTLAGLLLSQGRTAKNQVPAP